MNVVAVGVDARRERPIVNRLHAVWSMGAVAGGLIGATLAAADASVTTHFVVAAVHRCRVEPHVHRARAHAGGGRGAAATRTPVRWWHSRPLLALAAMGVAVSVLEGAPLDWGTLYLTDVLDASSGVAAAATVTFTVGMVLARLGGDHLVHRFGVRRCCGSARARPRSRCSPRSIVDNVPVDLRRVVRDRCGCRDVVPGVVRRRGPGAGSAPGRRHRCRRRRGTRRLPARPALIGALADRYSLRPR